jgi:hypothetical protein
LLDKNQCCIPFFLSFLPAAGVEPNAEVCAGWPKAPVVGVAEAPKPVVFNESVFFNSQVV